MLIHKKGDMKDLENYHLISLNKLFTKVLMNKITATLDSTSQKSKQDSREVFQQMTTSMLLIK